MSHTYAGNGTYPALITLPDDAESRNAAAMNVPIEGVANRTSYLEAARAPLADVAALKAINTTGFVTGVLRNVLGVGWYYFDSAGSGTEVQPHLITPTTGGGRWKIYTYMPTTRSVFCPVTDVRDSLSAGWAFGTNVGGALEGPATTDVQGFFIPPGCLHDGATLASIDVIMQTDNGRAALPAQQPKVVVGRFPRLTGTDGTLTGAVLLRASATQAAFATVADYRNSDKAVEFNSPCTQNNVIDLAQYEYTISLTDENGANSVAGNLYWGARLNFTNILPGRWP